ncbi:MAG: hypothetical protein PF630_04440 [Gammaproteobacteria bacterium]|nr:hypothetical protein [Gammaproteobacteria bacterium]
MNSGNYQLAYNTFLQCAQAGDPYCINNIGVMFERGHMQGGQNLNDAIEYYKLAARYGIPIAQQNLVRLGHPVPQADLQYQYQQRLLQEQQAAAELSRSLGCALGGGCQSQSAYQPSSPSYQYTNPAPYQYTNPAPKTITPAGCNSDFDCGLGNQCVKPSGSFGSGRCVTPVDDFGNNTFDMPTPSVGPREVSSCQFTNRIHLQ